MPLVEHEEPQESLVDVAKVVKDNQIAERLAKPQSDVLEDESAQQASEETESKPDAEQPLDTNDLEGEIPEKHESEQSEEHQQTDLVEHEDAEEDEEHPDSSGQEDPADVHESPVDDTTVSKQPPEESTDKDDDTEEVVEEDDPTDTEGMPLETTTDEQPSQDITNDNHVEDHDNQPETSEQETDDEESSEKVGDASEEEEEEEVEEHEAPPPPTELEAEHEKEADTHPHADDENAHDVVVEEEEEEEEDEEEEEEQAPDMGPKKLGKFDKEEMEEMGFGKFLYAYRVVAKDVAVRTKPSPIGGLTNLMQTNKKITMGLTKDSHKLGDIVVGYKVAKVFGLWLKLAPFTWMPIIKKDGPQVGFHPVMKQIRKITIPGNFRKYWRTRKLNCAQVYRTATSRTTCEEKNMIRDGVLQVMRKMKLMDSTQDPDIHPFPNNHLPMKARKTSS